MSLFLQNHSKKENENICILSQNFGPIKIQTCSSPQNGLLNLSFVKDIEVIGKKPTRYGHKMDFCQLQRPFMSRKFNAPPSTIQTSIAMML